MIPSKFVLLFGKCVELNIGVFFVDETLDGCDVLDVESVLSVDTEDHSSMDMVRILVGEDVKSICDVIVLELFFDTSLGYWKLDRLILPNPLKLLVSKTSGWHGSKSRVSELGMSEHSAGLCRETVSSSFTQNLLVKLMKMSML